MDRIAVLPDIRPTGYPAILKTGYQISGWILDISDIERVTQIIETSQIFKQDLKCLINIIISFSEYPDF